MLVGRRRELEAARRRLRRGASLAVVGEAGVGKTALITEAVGAAGGSVHAGGGLAGLAHLPYLALERALRDRIPFSDPHAVWQFVQERVPPGDLLVLDDLQWSAPATLELLPRLDRQLAVAIRSGDPRADDAIGAVAACGIEPLMLHPLDDADSRRLVATLRPDLSTEAVSRLVLAAAGNPLLLRELDLGGSPSPSLLLSLQARLERASPAARDAAEVLALLGRPAEPHLLPPGAVDELRAVDLVVGENGRVALRHALLAEAVVASMNGDSRRRRHERIAESLRDPGEAARHNRAAGRPERALEQALLATESADAPEERAAHLELAADVAGAGPEADGLRLRAAEALLQVGAFARADALAARVATRAPQERAQSLLIRGSAQWALGRTEEAWRSVDRGLKLVRGTKTPVEARLRIARCQPLLNSGRYRAARASARSALALAEEIGTHTAQAQLELGAALYWSGSEEALDHAELARGLARLEGDGSTELAALQLAGVCQFMLKLDSSRSLRLFGRMEERAAVLRLPGWQTQARWVLAHCENWAFGRYDEVIPILREVAAAPAFGHTDPDQVFSDLAIALADVGEVQEARRVLDERAEGGRADWGRGVLLLARAELEWLMRRPSRALDAVRRFSESVTEPNLATQMCVIRDYASRDLARPVGPAPPPNRLPIIDLFRLECLAIGALDRPGEAERRFLEVARRWHRLGLRFEVRCLWAAGEAARLDSAQGRARSHLLRAERLALQHGLKPMLGRIRRSLRAIGTRRAARSGNGSLLTSRELSVLELVGRGLSSREIAARLALSPHTVDSIVKSSMTKLGVTTRLSAAVKAAAGT